MSQVTKTQAIKAFLTANAPSDLATLYNENMEVQVTVAKDNGERTEGDFKGKMWHGYTDGMQVWKPIRIPRNANTEPEYEDTPMTYDLAAHAEGIGMTGWDWKNRVSRWVAFDFDAIIGHSDKHAKKLTEEELAAIQAALNAVPTVTVRRSTGGKGLHLYVFLQPIPTANHNEHAAVARAILSQLSGIAGFDFSSKVDICGGNMWVWHRKLKTAPEGLSVIKVGTMQAEVPSNWKDYTKVVSGRRQKNLPRFIETQTPVHNDIESVFEELTGQRLRTQPDPDHRRVMDWLFTNYGSCSWWDAEHHMLVTHTHALKEAHTELNLRGKFETNATGTERGYDHNCFAFPIAKGAWAVRRYTLGVAEHPFWEQDGAGWTRCFYNREPDLGGAARIYEGIERPEGGYHFATAEQAQKAALLLGADLKLPNWIMGKPTSLRMHKSGRLVAEVEKDANTPALDGWIVKGKKASRIFSIKSPGPNESETFKLDEQLRHVVGEDGMDAGWVIKCDGEWNGEPFQHVKVYLQGQGYQPKDVAAIMGSNIQQCWRLVNRPFKDEYPKDRQWNRNAAQLRFKPSLNRDNLSYPNWMKILQHCGKGLDDAVRTHHWCKSNGILTGADYLKCWIASMFQEPTEPLAYLFFYGPQDSGKSIFHEALSLLMTRGVVRADTALTSQSGFNGELENAVLCVVEETNLQKNATAYNRIKDWVTSRQLPVHRKQRQPYTVQNTTHWVQCLPKDSWIMTEFGHRQISNLIGHPVVLIVDGQRYKTEGFFASGRKEVFSVRTQHGHELRATADHPVLVDYDGLRMWRKVSQLRLGDRVCFNRHVGVEWHSNGDFNQGYLLGYLFADGTLTNCHIEVAHPDRPLLPFILSCLSSEYTLNALPERWDIHSQEIRDICEAFGVTDKKIVTEWIEEASSDFLSGFLSGLFDGDGCVSFSDSGYLRVCFQQTDIQILRAVQRILLCFGVYSKISGEQLRICNESVRIFQDRIGFQHPEKRQKLDKALEGKRHRDNNDFTDKVAGVELVGMQDVFDVTVPGAECFSANGFKVHNCANSHLACPVFPGDTRITMVLVDSLDPSQMIPKKQFLPMLEKEAPDFIAELLGLELPPSNDRLNIPCIGTEDKALAEFANQTFLELFISEKAHYIPGHRVKFGDFYARFMEWLDPQHAHLWSQIRVGRELPPRFAKGRMTNNEMWIGNMSFEDGKTPGLRYVVREGKLVQDELAAVLQQAGPNQIQGPANTPQ